MLEDLAFLDEQLPWFFPVAFFVFGACMGSFLNVCIYRIPKKQSVVKPRSHCMACGKLIPWWHNLPVLSWLLLRGRAACCGAPFSPRYAIVEALTGLLFAACWLLLPPALALVGMVFISFLVPATFVDLDTMELPDIFTIGGMLVGVFASVGVPQLHVAEVEGIFLIDALRSLTLAMVGIVVGSGVILWIALLAETVLRKEAMGFGDVVFMGCIGAFCGWQGAIFAIFGGAALGTFIVLPLMLFKHFAGSKENAAKSPETTEKPSEEEETAMGTAIPFGPWLALGGLVYYLFLQAEVDAWFAQFQTLLFGSL